MPLHQVSQKYVKFQEKQNIKYTADSLLRHYYTNCELSKWFDFGKGHVDFSLTKSVLPDKFREISAVAFPQEKINLIIRTVSVNSLKRLSDSARNYSTDWETLLLCSSSSSSPSKSQEPKKELNWRVNNLRLSNERSLVNSKPQIIIASDASM